MDDRVSVTQMWTDRFFYFFLLLAGILYWLSPRKSIWCWLNIRKKRRRNFRQSSHEAFSVSFWQFRLFTPLWALNSCAALITRRVSSTYFLFRRRTTTPTSRWRKWPCWNHRHRLNSFRRFFGRLLHSNLRIVRIRFESRNQQQPVGVGPRKMVGAIIVQHWLLAWTCFLSCGVWAASARSSTCAATRSHVRWRRRHHRRCNNNSLLALYFLFFGPFGPLYGHLMVYRWRSLKTVGTSCVLQSLLIVIAGSLSVRRWNIYKKRGPIISTGGPGFLLFPTLCLSFRLSFSLFNRTFRLVDVLYLDPCRKKRD